ncbi:hypothetical protein F3Y22_tig00111191pilonHSYRG00235 [Hibiscus syriacus]|uniref:Uncharacterized protein n=2 Tax=Hibiscus syriacus TaxID=106335 RepID=A0A6A2YWH4_HIBSY|nr:hypothetical protein F3Y22_tig00111191pilonHSYRG00235 [Hibiscus syriacus]
MVLANENQMLKEEKVAWTTENHNLTVNMAIISENFGKLSAQCEALSQSINCRQQDEQTTAHNGQSDIQMIHQQLKLVTLNVLQIKTDMLAALKQGLLSLDGFRQSDEQIPTQNRQPNITRNHHASTSASESQGCQQASTSCPQPNEPIQEQARQPTIEHIHPSTYSAKQQLAPESFQTTQNDSQISSVVQDPQRTTSVSTEGGIVTSSHLTENQENSLATSMPMAELLNKVDEKGKSKADFSDFPSLDKNDRVKVGRYDVPKSLHSTAQKIMDKYGDVTKESIMHHDVDERTFILSCASMKEMEELPLDHVTEDYILKWSDTTKTALEMRFDVEFMMDELKKGIVPSYSDRVKFQASWDDLQQTYAKRRKLFME